MLGVNSVPFAGRAVCTASCTNYVSHSSWFSCFSADVTLRCLSSVVAPIVTFFLFSRLHAFLPASWVVSCNYNN